MTDPKRKAVYLASLLHDIGKFYQRADKESSRQFTEDLKSTYCPFNRQMNYHSHVHVLWTVKFLEENKDHFFSLLSGHYESFLRAAAGHHKPDNNSVLQMIVQKADHYSSGVDRQAAPEAIMDTEDEKKRDAFKRKRMCSIFENIMLDEEIYHYRLPIEELSLEYDRSFPLLHNKFERSGNTDYEELWPKFVSHFKELPKDHFDAFLEGLVYLLETFVHNIPSSTIHLPDVSLFDHLKSTSALAICIYDYLKEKNNLSKLDITDNDTPILLIGGDISGIQKFIYDIISTNAAKNLKGRSFYLQLLVDNILQTLLNELGLANINVLYGSGGGFYILAPNTQSIRQKLAACIIQIEQDIFHRHKSSLFLALDYEEVSQQTIMSQGIGDVWVSLSQKLNQRKRQRYKKIMVTSEGYDNFFLPTEAGGKRQRDVITNEEIMDDEAIEYLDRNEVNPLMPVKRDTTYQQIQLGKQLKNADYWIRSQRKIGYWNDTSFKTNKDGFYNYLISKETLERYRLRLSGSVDQVLIRSINNTEPMAKNITGNGNIHGFIFYGGNEYPEEPDGTPLSFDKLAGDEDKAFKRLGVLRMDVDNLGTIFKSGFSERKRTFSRYATLSRGLDFFFKGYLNTIWKSNDDYSQYTYILYSGGDDLFIVGKWDTLIKLAKDIRKSFTLWTCQNKKISLSGGIAIVPGKFPIVKAASLAEQAEKKAKSHSYQGHEKDSFTFLNCALNWDYELPLVESLKDQLVKLISVDQVLPNSILQRILAFYEQAQIQSGNNENESWKWQVAYHFARASKITINEAAIDFLKEIQKGIFAGHCTFTKQLNFEKDRHTFFDLLTLAARWAELTIRN